ncbi:prenylcysteine oxidase 1 [Corythoichthys intestinalis]|uniref:prenylcysteine oxidase 1 n=1 Tax=Corythoichthys intestinalis TaxID=161448 RepID=UPI0025A5A848|nr:prenylcysteine oxidase 1 [Corythoichthys intestinalis]XP_057675808.1 prenylcysteine oxidase 1 [Corythoichthys intestinalis]XP_061800845.1 prenylcysteine oxidase 1-like [Nerophis lumbriciformis]
MSVETLSLRSLLFLGICLSIRRSLASSPELLEPPTNIAVVGAGIGGAAAAFYLRQEFGATVKIDVFEPGDVGGRLATAEMAKQEYETGGVVIHPLNLHMKHFVDKLGISMRQDVPSKKAVFDGNELTFEESDWFIVNFLRMLWRYGLNYLFMQMWVESVMDKFMRIYQYQQYGYSFTSVERLLHAMGGDDFLSLMNRTLEETMRAEGFPQIFLNHVAAPLTRVTYGQSVRINSLAGALSLAAADSGHWAVDGGNKRVCSGLLYHSKSELIQARVTNVAFKVRPSKTGPSTSFYEVNYIGDTGAGHSMYDIVVIATPLHQGKSDISFSGLSPPTASQFPGIYHQVFSVLVHGVLNTSYLGVTRPSSEFTVSEVLTVDSEDNVMYSLTSLDPVHIPSGYSRPPASSAKVWKVFSPRALSQDDLARMFLSWDSVSQTPWLAYPTYRPPRRQIPPFILHKRLYYLSAVEWAASSMEMSAISARNAALLAHHRWHEQTGRIDQEDLHTRLRGEL